MKRKAALLFVLCFIEIFILSNHEFSEQVSENTAKILREYKSIKNGKISNSNMMKDLMGGYDIKDLGLDDFEDNLKDLMQPLE